MSNLGDGLRARRKQLGLSQEQVAESCDTGKSNVSKWERGEVNEIGRSKIAALAKVLQISPLYILGITDDMFAGMNLILADEFTGAHRSINIYGSVAAGEPIEANDEVVDTVQLPEEWFNDHDDYIGIKVKGDSMYPRYLDGDVVIIRIQPDCESGQTAVVFVNGYDATVKTVIKNPDGTITLKPTNPEYKPKIIDPMETSIIIFGVVVQMVRREA